MANTAWLLEKMLSNSVKLMAKLSHMLLKPPCSSLILARDKLIKGHDDLISLPDAIPERYDPIKVKLYF